MILFKYFTCLITLVLQPVLVDEKGAEIEGERSGYLCVKFVCFMAIVIDMEQHTSVSSLATILVEMVVAGIVLLDIRVMYLNYNINICTVYIVSPFELYAYLLVIQGQGWLPLAQRES